MILRFGAALIAVIGPVLTTASRGGEIRWGAGLREALATSRRTDQPVLVYVHSRSCGYCRMLEAKTWADPAIARLANDAFVPVRLDAELNADEIGRLGIGALPTVLVVSARGGVLRKVEGYVAPSRMLKTLKAAVEEGSASR